jgi:hypothetical protein
MNCPYCSISFNLDGVNAQHAPVSFDRIPFHGGSYPSQDESNKQYTISAHKCPECRKQIMCH